MCFYVRLVWTLVTALIILWLFPRDMRHGEIRWLWSVPIIGVFPQWGMLCLVSRWPLFWPLPYVHNYHGVY